MKPSRKWLVGSGLLVSLCFAAYFAFPFFQRPPIPVPASAKWVRCSEFGYWLAYDLEVRFGAPYEDCLKSAQEIVARISRDNTNFSPPAHFEIKNGKYISTNKTHYPPDLANHLAGTKWWFCPDHIKNGEFFAAQGGLAPWIWIDRDRNLFFYHVTD